MFLFYLYLLWVHFKTIQTWYLKNYQLDWEYLSIYTYLYYIFDFR